MKGWERYPISGITVHVALVNISDEKCLKCLSSLRCWTQDIVGFRDIEAKLGRAHRRESLQEGPVLPSETQTGGNTKAQLNPSSPLSLPTLLLFSAGNTQRKLAIT